MRSLINQPQAPKQYLQGYSEFYKLKFKVTPDVLIPRPETELLVDEVLNFVNSYPLNPNPDRIGANPYPLTILDLGTGSGCIAISLAVNLPGAQIIATDVSEKALEIAKINAKTHKVENKIAFIQSDLLSYLSPLNPNPDPIGANPYPLPPNVIVTNLPYIPTQKIPYLDSSVKDYEPHVALDGGEDGFKLYRKLFKQIINISFPHREWEPDLIVGEIDYTHAEIALKEAQKYFPKASVEVKKDLTHKQRILIIQN